MAGNRFNRVPSAIKRPWIALAAGAIPFAALLAACASSGRSAPAPAAATVATAAVADVSTAAVDSAARAVMTSSGAARISARTAETPVPGAPQATPAAGGQGRGKDRAAQTLTLDNVLKGFKRRGLPVGATTNLTATSDPDGLLGTAGQYTAKLLFADTSLGTPSGSPAVDDGGAVEVFATEQDAARAKRTLSTSGTSGTVYRLGNVVLLLSSRLSADQVSGYEIALKQAFTAARKQAIRAQAQQGATPTPTPSAP
jgi:hypothetical protein